MKIAVTIGCHDSKFLRAWVNALRAISARNRGEPIEMPPLFSPNAADLPGGRTLCEALIGWQKERSPSQGVFAECDRMISGDDLLAHAGRARSRRTTLLARRAAIPSSTQSLRFDGTESVHPPRGNRSLFQRNRP
jgi:hypothetical protein